MIALLTGILCAIAFRLRGSALFDKWTHTGTMGGRGLWAIVAGGCFAAIHGQWIGILAVPAFFLGSIPGWPDSIDLGRNEGEFWRDFWGQTWRGAVFLAPAAPIAWLVGAAWWPYLIAGALCGAIYWACWEVDFHPISVDDDPATIAPGPPLGELVFGFWLGLIIGVA